MTADNTAGAPQGVAGSSECSQPAGGITGGESITATGVQAIRNTNLRRAVVVGFWIAMPFCLLALLLLAIAGSLLSAAEAFVEEFADYWSAMAEALRVSALGSRVAWSSRGRVVVTRE